MEIRSKWYFSVVSAFVILGSIAYAPSSTATVIRHTPSGVSTVSQDQSLWFDILSDQTSTVAPIGPYAFELSDHGDFHFNYANGPRSAAMPGIGQEGINLATGTYVDDSLPWRDGTYYVGTDGSQSYGRGCVYGSLCVYGIRIDMAGLFRYGWVQFEEVDASTQRLLEWAYETDPNTPILVDVLSRPAVPLPGPLTLIAIGIAGMRARKMMLG